MIVINLLLSPQILTAYLRSGLERLNGATVDLDSAELNLKQGKIRLTGLAMADPNALGTDLLRAGSVEIDVSVMSMLTKRMKLDRIELTDASTGQPRTTPGRIVGRPPTPAQGPAPTEGQKTIEDYIQDAKTWKQRLAQARRWLEWISGPSEPSKGGPTRSQQLRQRINELGYAHVTASHLIDNVPMVTIGQLVADRVQAVQVQGMMLDIHGRNLSTQPNLLGDSAELTVHSDTGGLELDVTVAGRNTDPHTNHLTLAYRGIPVDEITKNVRFVGGPPISGGTVDISATGEFQGGIVDMDMNVTLNDTKVDVPGAGTQDVDELDVPVGVKGPMDDPRLSVDPEALAKSLTKAGVTTVIKQWGKKAGDAGEGAMNKAGDAIKGLFKKQ
jgi:hypothetical protein